jgi:predicted permease
VSVPVLDRARANSQAGSILTGFSWAFPSVGSGETQETLNAQLVEGHFFLALRVKAELGRLIGPDDDYKPSGNIAAVLSYAYWRRSGSPNVGTRFLLDGRPVVIIGVADKRFEGIDGGSVDVWCPLHAAPEISGRHDLLSNASITTVRPVARILNADSPDRLLHAVRSAVQEVEASGQGQPVIPRAELLSPPLSQANTNLLGSRVDSADDYLEGYGIAALCVLIICCTNVASLFLIRSLADRKLLLTQLALGATTVQLAVGVITDAVVVAVLGTGIAFAVASARNGLVLLLPVPPQPTFMTGRVIIGAIIVAIIAAGSIAVIPVLQVARAQPAGALRAGSATISGAFHRLGRALIILQLSAAFVLVASAVSWRTAMADVRKLKSGIPSDHLLSVGVLTRSTELHERVTAAQQLQAEIATRPDVISVGLQSMKPFRSDVSITTRPGEGPPDAARLVRVDGIDTAYFNAAGIGLIAGRNFRAEDYSSATPPVIVNDVLAKAFWPSTNAVGHCIELPLTRDSTVQGHCLPVVGVAKSVTYSRLSEPPTPFFYFPIGTADLFPLFPYLIVRTRPPAAVAAKGLRDVVSAFTGNNSGAAVEPVETFLYRDLERVRAQGLAFSIAGVGASLISGIGVFSLMTLFLEDRRREFAIRAAVGASPRRLALKLGGEGFISIIAASMIGVAAFEAFMGTFGAGDMQFRLGFWGIAAGFMCLFVASAFGYWRPAATLLRMDVMTELRD